MMGISLSSKLSRMPLSVERVEAVSGVPSRVFVPAACERNCFALGR